MANQFYGTSINDYFGSGVANYLTYDHLYGGDGDDTMYGYYSGGSMIIEGGQGNDTLYVNSSSVFNATVYGGDGNDTISAVAGSTTGVFYLFGGLGSNFVYGGGGFCLIYDEGIGSSLYGSNVASSFNEFFNGRSGNSVIHGSTNGYNSFHIAGSNNTVYGGNLGDTYSIEGFGSSIIYGGAGNDVFHVASSNNTIYTGDGKDTLWALGSDDSTIIGGAGDKLFFVGSSIGHVTSVTAGSGNSIINAVSSQGINYLTPGTGSGVNVVVGNDYSNHIYGNNTNGTLYMRGGHGQDELVGGHGANFFIGGGGSDFAAAGGSSNLFEFNSAAEGNLHIYYFNSATDAFGISADGFQSGLYAGEHLTAGYNLINGTQSVANTATFLYSLGNYGNGVLSFDPDGTGSHAAVVLASLEQGSVPNTLTADNFHITSGLF